jgi:UDP-N-acetylglucosamine--N-acetylmuramyl-(pentapeptide) pyrophosphoryl-undecaprenol N-acetylglucosamine transferase
MAVATAPRILLAAGGTGGHMFPAEALAHALLARGLAVDLATDERGGGFGDRLPEVRVHRIASGGVAGKGAVARLRNVLRLGWGFLQSRSLLRRLRPAVVVGFGGYPSIPPLAAAQRSNVPTLLHEQNAVMGRANRFLAKSADRLALSFDQVQFADVVPAGRRTITGNPVRPEISSIADAPYVAPRAAEPVRLFVMGGSLGARVFGKAVPEAVALLHRDLRRRLAIAQQARAEDMAQVGEAYRALDLAVELKPFFEDVPQRLRQAHLLITRAGASTLAELTAAGRPAVLVPLPNSIDDHQVANARALDTVGGGWLLPESTLSPSVLAKILEEALADPARLEQAATAAKSIGKRDAADRLAELVIDLLPQEARAALQRGMA